MPKIENYSDLTIRWKGHQKYNSRKVVENDIIEVIVQKLEMILFTAKNEVLGADEMGIDLEYYLWQTKVANDIIKSEVVKQVNEWIPELNIIGYTIDVKIFEGTYRDIMHLNFTINGYNVSFIFD